MGQLTDWSDQAEQQRKAGIDFERHVRTDRYKKLERKYEQKLKEKRDEDYEDDNRDTSSHRRSV